MAGKKERKNERIKTSDFNTMFIIRKSKVMGSILKALRKKKILLVHTCVANALTASRVQDNYRGED